MYVGVDIGGTKTLVATIDDHGVIIEKIKFGTPQNYDEFITELGHASDELHSHDFIAGCVAVPGKIDRENGIGEQLGNLSWQNVPIQADVEKILNCPILIENDANLGGLSESMLLPADWRVLYITISTGIGTGFIDHQHISDDLSDSEGGHMMLEYHGKRVMWEKFASGKAIVERFGKKAVDITDESIWRRIAHDLSIGFIELIAIMQPDAIVIGGSVGNYLERYKDQLIAELHSFENPLVTIPPIRQAARPDDAVLYGCYDLAHSKYGRAT